MYEYTYNGVFFSIYVLFPECLNTVCAFFMQVSCSTNDSWSGVETSVLICGLDTGQRVNCSISATNIAGASEEIPFDSVYLLCIGKSA